MSSEITTQKIDANRFRTALIFFLITAGYGWILRLYRVVDFIPIEYKNLLQSHSHITFLGWGFLATLTLILAAFPLLTIRCWRLEKWVYQLMVWSLAGLLISFPLQGYKAISIALLSIFLLASYIYLFRLLRALSKDHSPSAKFIRTAIYFYYLSSVGIWVLPVVLLRFGKGIYYYDTIYFYLHFLYNGFFVFALFGIMLKQMEPKINRRLAVTWWRFFYWTALACIPAYALSLLWKNTALWVYWTAVLGAIVQFAALFFLRDILRHTLLPKKQKKILQLILLAYALKVTFQLLSVIPGILNPVFEQKQFIIIGYLHLFTLGFMSLFLLWLYEMAGNRAWNRTGMLLLIAGILLSETMLFTQGLLNIFQGGSIPYFPWLMLIVSSLMPIGILLLLLKFKNGTTSTPVV